MELKLLGLSLHTDTIFQVLRVRNPHLGGTNLVSYLPTLPALKQPHYHLHQLLLENFIGTYRDVQGRNLPYPMKLNVRSTKNKDRL